MLIWRRPQFYTIFSRILAIGGRLVEQELQKTSYIEWFLSLS
jgi:hypothetical protein